MVSIIIPIIRPDKAAKCIEAIKRNAGDVPYEIVTEIDIDGIGCPRMVEKLTNLAKYDLVMFLGDDTEPMEGFLQAALDAMATLPDGWGVVGLNTQHEKTKSNYQAHWLADKTDARPYPRRSVLPDGLQPLLLR